MIRSDSKSKKKFDSYVADSNNNDKQTNSKNISNNPPHLKTGSASGFSFVGQFGALDCSIGSIFRDEFGKNLKMSKTTQEQLGRALSVLIIDDSIIQRKLTMRTLGGLIDEVMWMVEGAENGELALNLIETSPRVPDVIIVDQYMETSGGQLLGHEVVAELRRNVSFDTSVIVGCTGSVDEAGPFFLEAGCDAVWSKPMPSKDEAHAQILTLLLKRKNNSLLVSESIPSHSSSSMFTLENNGGFSNGVGGASGVPSLPLQQRQEVPPSPTSPQQPPVFCQLQPHQVSESDSHGSYFVSATASDGSSVGSVFQFGAPPSTNTDSTFVSPRSREELTDVTETLSNIKMATE